MNQKSSPSKKTRIVDIVKHTGLSVGTVSMALNGNPVVNARTRERVLKAAKELNFRPNLQAQSFRLQRTKRAAMILPELENTFYSEKLSRAREVLWANGYELAFACTEWNPEAEVHLCEYFLDHQVDAIIFSGLSDRSVDIEDRSFEHIEMFSAAGKPVCVMGFVPRQLPGVVSIRPKMEDGIYQALKLLFDFGHRRIGLLGVKTTHRFRWQGIERVLREKGFSEDTLLEIPEQDQNMRGGSETVERFLSEQGREALPTALLALNDNVAIGAMSSLQHHGFRIPQDISIIGCDNISFSAYVVPSLTTVSQNPSLLGEAAAEITLQQLRQGECFSRTITEPVELIIRESTGPAPR